MFIRLFLAAILIGLSSQTLSSMQVERTVIHFEPGEAGRQDVEVRNPGKDPLYVQVELLDVVEPGTPDEQRILVQNPRDVGFLVTPNKLVVPPGGRKLVRFVNLSPLGDKERVFRVNLKPVASHERSEETTAIKVLVGYQLLIFIQPAEPAPQVTGFIDGNKLKLTNVGNTNVMMQRGLQCENPKKKEKCVELPTKRLYPGNTWEVDVDFTTPVEYIMSSGLNNQPVIYNNEVPEPEAATAKSEVSAES